MEGLETAVIGAPDVEIHVTHLNRTELSPAERAGSWVESLELNDTLSRVELVDGTRSVEVRVLWSRAAAARFSVLYAAQTYCLYLGGGQLMCAIDLTTSELVLEEHPLLFWGFERTGELIVAFGEVECLLLDLAGSVLGRAAVDPPYEVRRLGDRYEFESIVSGVTQLVFPVS